MSFKKEHRQETVIYLGLWALLFMAPVMVMSIRIANTDIAFDWQEVFKVWREYALFFVVFLIHNHFLAPQLIYRQRKLLYVGCCLAIIVLFHTYQINHRPDFKGRDHHHREMMVNKPDRPPLPPDDMHMPDEDFRPKHRPDNDLHKEKRPPMVFGQHDIISIVILILMLGMNLGIKLYFRQSGDHKKMEDLERQNLKQQLEYLKYQINPHFFMNTLNNIHALVDIDPEKAKQTILELSKMMRFVLYEGNKQGVPLDREIAFLQNYIKLMKLRYTDKVKIKVSTPEQISNNEVPPLMFITFVENAFKHGVSYRQESFVDIAIEIPDAGHLVFTCNNSRIPSSDDKHGGVGLTNVKQRLDLIYGKEYSLEIKDEPDIYSVVLTIPLGKVISEK